MRGETAATVVVIDRSPSQQQEPPLPGYRCVGGERGRSDEVQHLVCPRAGVSPPELCEREGNEDQERTEYPRAGRRSFLVGDEGLVVAEGTSWG
jgi:hypothetical protein